MAGGASVRQMFPDERRRCGVVVRGLEPACCPTD